MLRSLTVTAVLMALIGVNIIFYNFPIRFDFTEGQIYTLSSSTKKLVKNLEDDIYIKVFLSKKLPSQAMNIKQDLQDYLKEYDTFSSNLKISYTDPAGNEEEANLARFLGIPELQLQVIEKDQQQVVKAYMGLAVLKEKDELPEETENNNPLDKYEKYETIPVIQNFSNFEYDLTAAIKKVSSIEEKVLGFLLGHDEHNFAIQNQYFQTQEKDLRMDYNFKELLEKNYTVNTVSLSEENPKIENIDTLVIAGPKKALADFEVGAIKDFVKSGGNAVFLIDQIDIANGLFASKLEENFSNLLSDWGISVDKSLVKDKSHSRASFSQGFISYTLPYPYWVKVSNLSKENAITAKLDYFVLPWGSPLNITEKEDVNVDVIAKTSPFYSLSKAEVLKQVPVEDETKTEDTEEEPTEENSETVSFFDVLLPTVSAEEAAEVKIQNTAENIVNESTEEIDPPVKMKEEWQDQPINLDPQQDFGLPRSKLEPLPLAAIAQKDNEGKIFVMGDSDFVSGNFASQFNANLAFLMNIIDSFTLGDELISIRSKAIQDRPIKDINEATKNIIKWGNIIVVPLIFIGLGLIRRSLRNAKKNIVI